MDVMAAIKAAGQPQKTAAKPTPCPLYFLSAIYARAGLCHFHDREGNRRPRGIRAETSPSRQIAMFFCGTGRAIDEKGKKEEKPQPMLADHEGCGYHGLCCWSFRCLGSLGFLHGSKKRSRSYPTRVRIEIAK